MIEYSKNITEDMKKHIETISFLEENLNEGKKQFILGGCAFVLVGEELIYKKGFVSAGYITYGTKKYTVYILLNY